MFLKSLIAEKQNLLNLMERTEATKNCFWIPERTLEILVKI